MADNTLACSSDTTQKSADPVPKTPTSATDNVQKQVTIISCLSRSNDITSVATIVWNELLAYVNFYRNQSSNVALRRVAAGLFSPDDISSAKKLLVKQFLHRDGVEQFTTEGRSSTVRLAHEAEV